RLTIAIKRISHEAVQMSNFLYANRIFYGVPDRTQKLPDRNLKVTDRTKKHADKTSIDVKNPFILG
ncbi:hypothetical protein, partial [Bacillus ndiopicus]|uniref:hypothetical protein n=1 Tax=Bacillus ndiopicus TaxID=1347368 RepID=UPI0005A69584